MTQKSLSNSMLGERVTHLLQITQALTRLLEQENTKV